MTIDDFLETIMKLQAGTFMAMQGAETGILGSNNGGYILQELQRSAIEFTQQFKAGQESELKLACKAVIAKIMVSQTLGAIGEKQADKLLDGIHQLMKERK